MANTSQSNNFYSNPAFCQQSEYFNYPQCKSPRSGLSPQRVKNQTSARQSPVGAQSPTRVVDNSFRNVCESVPPKPGPKPQFANGNENYQEQDFYEEMLVDDSGFVKQKKIVVLPSNNNRNTIPIRYSCVPQETPQGPVRKVFVQQENGNRYAIVPTTEEDHEDTYHQPQKQKSRYEYIHMQKQDANHNPTTPKKEIYNEEFELGNRRMHRYEVIEIDEETDLNIQCSPNQSQNYKYSVVPQYNDNRYGYVEEIQRTAKHPNQQKLEESYQQRTTSPRPIKPNPYATQKLHDLIVTPKKATNSPRYTTPQKITSPHSPRRSIATISADPFITTPSKTLYKPPPPSRERSSKAQQKLNYTLSPRQVGVDKRHTAIVAPICSTPQSVYSETTYSNKSESWMNLSGKKQPIQATLTVAASMMLICGGLTSCLCFYMVSIMGRLYFLDFGIVSGFACLVLGVLGCRSRNYYYWLPNRNYMSGYIILTLFSLLTCVGLLVLLFMQPKPGSPLADMTSGAVCGISVLSLILATAGVMTSYCCKLPPPDNRVEHCARGFTV